MTERVPIPGGRDVRGTLDEPEREHAGEERSTAETCVVACPPHPEHGGSSSDRRLRAVSDSLAEYGVACLRFDYGPWDEGPGERTDARNAIAWASERYERVGVFGYSFGGAIALLAVADRPDVCGLSVLAPAARVGADLDAVEALGDVDCPVKVIYGERDETVDWQSVVERARDRGHDVESVAADHHFVGQHSRIGDLAAEFLADTC